MDLSVTDILVYYGVLLVSLVVHEAAHALAALLGGDRTAYLGGQVTLNPLPHIRREPFGTVALPLLTLFLGGFIMGYAHTPIDANWAYRHPRRAALMSAAGPLANLILVGIAFGVLKVLIASGQAEAPYLHTTLIPPDYLTPVDGAGSGPVFAAIRLAGVFMLLNVLLALLNMIPLPPLDGAGILEGLFPRSLRGIYSWIRSQPFMFILVILLVLKVLPAVFVPAMSMLLSLL